MSLFQIKQALVTAYKAGNFFSDALTSYPNLDFTPPKNSSWAKVSFIPTKSEVFTLGPAGSGQDRKDGLFQVDLNFPPNSGDASISAKATDLNVYFYAGRKFVYSGQEVICRSCSISPGRNVDGFYRISVTIPFYGYVTR